MIIICHPHDDCQVNLTQVIFGIIFVIIYIKIIVIIINISP